jgi:RNA polymerase sigma-70 factor (family 1)
MSVYRNLTDEELALLLNESNRDAFGVLYSRYKGLLYVHAFRKVNDKDEAADVVHDLFADLWERRHSLSITGKVSAYLYTAVRYRVIKVIGRRIQNEKHIATTGRIAESSHCITDHLVREKMLMAIIEKEISALPRKMRQVFEMSRKAGLSHREIAERLDLSDETVRKHIQHALRTLRMKLGIVLYIYLLSQVVGAAYTPKIKPASTSHYFFDFFTPSDRVKGL